MYRYTHTHSSANKNAELSQLISAMGCSQERKLLIKIYRCLHI